MPYGMGKSARLKKFANVSNQKRTFSKYFAKMGINSHFWQTNEISTGN